MITLDLCHFAAYSNELEARAGSSRAWGISWVQQVVDAEKGQPGVRYQWLHHSGQLETAPVPAQELKRGGSRAGLGAEGASVWRSQCWCTWLLGHPFWWLEARGDKETCKRGKVCFKPPQCICSMRSIAPLATPVCHSYAQDEKQHAVGFVPVALGIQCLCPI